MFLNKLNLQKFWFVYGLCLMLELGHGKQSKENMLFNPKPKFPNNGSSKVLNLDPTKRYKSF